MSGIFWEIFSLPESFLKPIISHWCSATYLNVLPKISRNIFGRISAFASISLDVNCFPITSKIHYPLENRLHHLLRRFEACVSSTIMIYRPCMRSSILRKAISYKFLCRKRQCCMQNDEPGVGFLRAVLVASRFGTLLCARSIHSQRHRCFMWVIWFGRRMLTQY